MPITKTLQKPKTKVYVDPKLKTKIQEEQQVIIHCRLPVLNDFNYVRIWNSTFLICKQTGAKTQLAHFEGISLFPYWTEVQPKQPCNFTLYFKGLPKDCQTFDLIEYINEPGGFEVKNIKRSKSDVYKVLID
jgi:hypothetical protein